LQGNPAETDSAPVKHVLRNSARHPLKGPVNEKTPLCGKNRINNEKYEKDLNDD